MRCVAGLVARHRTTQPAGITTDVVAITIVTMHAVTGQAPTLVPNSTLPVARPKRTRVSEVEALPTVALTPPPPAAKRWCPSAASGAFDATAGLVSGVIQGASGVAIGATDAVSTGARAFMQTGDAVRARVAQAAADGIGAARSQASRAEALAGSLARICTRAAMAPLSPHPLAGEAVRELLADLVLAAGADESEMPKQVRAVFSNHSEALLAVLESGDLQAIAGAADLAEIVEAAGLDRGPALLQCWSLAAPDSVRSMAAWSLERALSMAPDSAFAAIGQELNAAIDGFDVGDFSLLNRITDPSEGMDLSDFPEEVGAELPKLMQRYFGNLTCEEKRRYIGAFLKLPPGSNESEQIAAMLQECGPGMQKLFQLAASKSKSKVLKTALEVLYGNIKPMSIEQVKDRIAEETGKPWQASFQSIDTKPLGAATVGQVHAATLHDGREVVVKVLRPGLREKMQAEFCAMRKAAGDNEYIRNFMLDLECAGANELDLRREGRNLQEGAKCYERPDLGIHVAGLEPTSQAKPGLLVMAKAPGRPFNVMPPAEELAAAGMTELGCLELKTQVLEQFMEVWYRTLAFDNAAFMHADLHPGNMFFELRPGQDPPYAMTIIDFGSAEKLHKTDQTALAKMGAAIAGHHYTGLCPDLATSTFLDGFEAFAGQMTPIQREQMGEVVKDILTSSDEHPIKKTEAILKKTAAFGIAVPLSALQLSRGHKFMEGVGQDLNRQMDALDPKEQCNRFSPSRAYVGGTAKALIPFGDTVYPALQAVGNAACTAYEYRDLAYAALLISLLL